MATPPRRRRRAGPPLRFVVPAWAQGEIADPFASIFRFHLDRQALIRAGALAVLLYGGAITAALLSPASTNVGPAPRREIPVITAPPPPPPPVAQPPAPTPPPKPVVAHTAKAPAPAQASKVITRAETPDQPADFSDFHIATGEGTVYAGGYTSSKGTNTSAVLAPPAPQAKGNGAPNLSRRAEPVRKDWTCNWPDEAASTELRETRVAVRVQVSPDGDALSAEVEGQALPGFADAARQCALGESFLPALDAAGTRIAGQTGTLIVHFVR